MRRNRMAPKDTAHPRDPYIAALRLLSRRELSERQVRERLLRKGHTQNAVDEAISRLKQERAIDDRRVAEAIARTQTSLKTRGRIRVRRELENAGVAADVARNAIDRVWDEIDDEALLQAALRRRLRSDRSIADDREFRRLYRYLVAQGFESDRIVAALKARRRQRGDMDDEEPMGPEPED